MRNFAKLKKFPLASIQPCGFLKDQLLLGKDGMAGNLYKLEPGIIVDPLKKRTVVDGWANEAQIGWGAEISGNYWTAYIQHAFTLNDAEMINTATEWVNELLKKQRDDGYLGAYDQPGDNIYDDYNAWGTMCLTRGLIGFYEATGRNDVLDAVHNCLLWFTREWAGDNKTSYCGISIIEPMVYTYELTGDERLVRFAEEYTEYLAEHDMFNNSYKAFLEKELYYNCNHTANMGIAIRMPALLYSVTGSEKYLRASERIIEQLKGKAIQLSGAPVSVTEFLGPVGSTTESEYCNFAFYNASYSCMSYISGNAKYGDYMEEVFYNAAQGARKKDERAIAYFTAPNQIYATEKSSSSTGDMQVYAPCYPTACCPVTSVTIVPEFIKGMMLTDANNHLYVAAYGPCTLDHGDFSIKEKTLYPFRNNVTLEIKKAAEYSVFLKIPTWADSYEIRINGEKARSEKNEMGYAEVHKAWSVSDTIEIFFDTDVKIIRVDDSDFAKKYPIAFKYGALLYSYHIPEKWRKTAGRPVTPLPEGYSWYNVVPDYATLPFKDRHEAKANKKDEISWNVAIDPSIRADDVTIEHCETDGYAWENAPIRLHTHCYKAPYLCSTYPTRTHEPFGDKQFVTKKLPLILEPYGCTNLRISYFPIADMDSLK